MAQRRRRYIGKTHANRQKNFQRLLQLEKSNSVVPEVTGSESFLLDPHSFFSLPSIFHYKARKPGKQE